MKLSLGFSTCPNDTFIFDAIVNKKIDLQVFDFDIVMADVEQLNKMTINQELDIAKISYHTYCYVANNYKILNSGSALGFGNGPLLVSKRKIYPDEVPYLKIAIPGVHTTAFLLLRILFNNLHQTKEYLFSEIEKALLDNEVDAGLIIHETRFTYQSRGLKKIADLGQMWEQRSNLPIPLGGIVIKREFDNNIQTKFDRILYNSIQKAIQKPNETYNFVKQHAQEMDTDIMQQHINLYVNEYSQKLNQQGKDAILYLLKEAQKIGSIQQLPNEIFV